MNMIDSFFKLSERNTKFLKEVFYGLLSFLPLIYVLPVISSTLGSVGINENGAFIATAISTGFACILAGLVTNKPIIQSIGLGMNAFFVYNICGKMGYSCEGGLTIIFISSILFLIFSITNVRKKIILSIPNEIRLAITIGLGAFLIYSGFKSAGFIVNINDNISLSYWNKPMIILFILGVVLTFCLMKIEKLNNYAVIIGIAFVAGIGYILNLFGVEQTPQFTKTQIDFSTLSETVFRFDFSVLKSIKTYIVIVIFTFMNVFDTGTGILALHSELDLDGENKELKVNKSLFLPDAIASIVSTSLGCSTVTTYAETKILCNSGSKTGISAITIGILFILSIFLYPVFTIFSGIEIEGAYYYPITSVGVVSIGIMLVSKLKEVDWKDYISAISTLIMLITMILVYSIPDGVGIGIIIYVILKLIFNKGKDLSKVMILITIIFAIYFLALLLI